MAVWYSMAFSVSIFCRREALVHSYAYSSSSDGAKKGIKGIFSRKKKKKIYYQNASPSSKWVSIGPWGGGND